MEELKNEEVLTEEIQEEETEIFEPGVDDIIPAEEVESKGSNGVVLFAAGALIASAVFGAVKLGKKFLGKGKAKKKDSNEDSDDDEVFEEDDPEVEEETESKK